MVSRGVGGEVVGEELIVPTSPLFAPPKSIPPNCEIPLRGLKNLLKGDGFIYFLFIVSKKKIDGRMLL